MEGNTYRCRMTMPHATTWTDVEAPTPEAAVQEYHFGLSRGDAGYPWKVQDEKEGTSVQ